MRWMTLPLIIVVLGGMAYGFWPRGPAPSGGSFDVAVFAAALGEDWTDGAGAPLTDEPLTFPVDHRAHRAAPAEVWDLSAILSDDADRELTLTLSLVRLGLTRQGLSAGRHAEAVGDPADAAADERSDLRRASAFAADELFAGQLVMSAGAGGPSMRSERVSRAALGLAGAGELDDGPARVWLEQWELVREGGQQVRVRAAGEGVELTLALSPVKRPISLNEMIFGGGRQDATAALRGYGEPRLMASGSIAVAGESRGLHGVAWLEHAWGALTEAVSGRRGQLVANRFRLQLDDGVDLSCLHLRRRGGGGTPIPGCLLINVDGDRVALQRRDLSLKAADEIWTSTDGVRYPLRWHLVIPGRDLELEIEPLLDDPTAALRTSVIGGVGPTWSGAVRVSGWRGSDALGGLGYMDLSGYAEASTGT